MHNLIEILQNLYGAEDLLLTLQKLRRVTVSGKRYYFADDGKFKMGITSFLSSILPMPRELDLFRHREGLERANQIRDERAEYGSLFHGILAECLAQKATGQYLPFDLDKAVWAGLAKANLHKEARAAWIAKELKEDILAFLVFDKTTDLRPLLLECSLPSIEMDLAATLDFFGLANIPTKGFFGEKYKTGDKKGQDKETTRLEQWKCLIDAKSLRKKEIEADGEQSDKQISWYNELQLNFQLFFLCEQFPHLKKDEIRLFNLIPRNWRTEPDMQLTEVRKISDECLRGLYYSWKEINPKQFDIAERRVPIIGNIWNGDINETLQIKKIGELYNEQ